LSKVAIVILNWNGKYFLEKFLPSVVTYNHPDAEIVVADNASSDDSLTFLEENYPDIKIIRNETNLGFAGGYNQALSQVDASYFILLNSDIEVSPDWIQPVIDLMDRDPNIAACQPKILSYNDRGIFEYAGASGGFIDKYGYPFCRGRIFMTLEQDNGQYDNAVEVFWATGACLFVRADCYRMLGGFDADFFAHMEEIDFCWRLKNHGYKVMVCPKSVIYHVGGGTLPKSSARKTYLNFRNNMALLFKNLPSHRILKVFIARLVLDFIASMKFLMEGHIKDYFAVIRAYISFYRTLPRTIRKRRLLLHKKTRHIYRGNIAFDYFLFGKKKFDDLNPHRFS